jgi:hypothetical protein
VNMSAPHTNEHHCMHHGKATTDCMPCKVDVDVWTQCAVHGPGERAGPVKLTNRSIIYLLHPPEGESFLVVLNGLWVDEASDQPFTGLRALEQQTGARIRFVLSPGAGHHLSLMAYARAFPDARICVAAGRISRENPALVSLDNVNAYPIDSPPEELEAAGLRVHVLRGLMEGPRTARAQFLTTQRWGYVCDSTEPLMVLHLPTGSLTSGGHHWWFRPAGHTDVIDMPGFMKLALRMMGLGIDYMKPGAVSCETNHTFAMHDRDAFQASCAEVLKWDFDILLDLHAPPNTCPTSGVKALFQTTIGPIAAADWHNVHWNQSKLPSS